MAYKSIFSGMLVFEKRAVVHRVDCNTSRARSFHRESRPLFLVPLQMFSHSLFIKWISLSEFTEQLSLSCLLPESQCRNCHTSASKRRGDILNGFTDFYLKANGIIWP